MKLPRATSFAALTLAVSLAACGGGPPAANRSAGAPASSGVATTPSAATGAGVGEPVAACDLLTTADVEELTGRTVEGAKPGWAMGTYENGCEWSFVSEPNRSGYSLILGSHAPGGKALYDFSFQGIATELGYEPVPGIGEAALRHTAGEYSALERDTIVQVFLVDDIIEPSSGDAVAKAILERALARAVGRAPGLAGVKPSAAAALDVCTLLPKEQFDEVAPWPLKEARAQIASCRFVLDVESTVPDYYAITLNVVREGGRQRFDNLGDLEHIPGVGDDAVKLGGPAGGTVWAVKGDTIAWLNYTLPTDTPDADPILGPLLELVLDAAASHPNGG